MDHFDDVFISFLNKDSIAYHFNEGQKSFGRNLKYVKLCSEGLRGLETLG